MDTQDGRRYEISGPNAWKWSGEFTDPYQQEHTNLIESIRAAKPFNELKQVADSTLTAICGRESAYTGKVVAFDQYVATDHNLSPAKLEFGPMADAAGRHTGEWHRHDVARRWSNGREAGGWRFEASVPSASRPLLLQTHHAPTRPPLCRARSPRGRRTFPLRRRPRATKVLYLTQSVGYKHEVLPLSEKILVAVGQKHGFAVTVSGDAFDHFRREPEALLGRRLLHDRRTADERRARRQP